MGVIVPAPSGTTYFTWVGNVAQRHVEIVGAWIPLPTLADRIRMGAVQHMWGHELPMRAPNEMVLGAWRRFAEGSGLEVPLSDALARFCAEQPRAALLAASWVPLAVGPGAPAELGLPVGRVVVVAWPNHNPMAGQVAD
jgi:hypothetical protein